MALTSTDIANLTTNRSNFAAKLAEISANPLPDYQVGNTNYSWVAYYQFLRSELEALDAKIVAATDGNGAWEVRSRVHS